MSELKELIENISTWIILLPLVLGSRFIKKLNRDSFIILVLVFAATPPQIATAFLEKRSGLLNSFYNIYTPVEFIILFCLFRNKFLNRRNTAMVNVTGIIYCIASFIIIFNFSLTSSFINEWACLNNILYVIWTLSYIAEIFFYNEIKVDKQSAFTYFLLGIFLYGQCTILIFSLYYYIPKNSILLNTWIIQSVSNITMYILFSIGFLVNAKSKLLISSQN